MSVYWLSFRLKDSEGYERTYSKRLQDLDDEIKVSCGNGSKWWFETSSFFIFDSQESLTTIVTRVKRAIDVDVDLVVIRLMNNQDGRVIGNCTDPDIFTLVPHLKPV